MSRILTIHWINKGVRAKISWDNTIVRRFLQGIWFRTQWEMEQIMHVYGLLNETAIAVMMI